MEMLLLPGKELSMNQFRCRILKTTPLEEPFMLSSTIKLVILLLHKREEVVTTLQILLNLSTLQFSTLMHKVLTMFIMCLKLLLSTDKSLITMLSLISLDTESLVTTSLINQVSHNHLCTSKLPRCNLWPENMKLS